MIDVMFVSQQHHGGYRFPWFVVGDQPNFHDYHHEKFVGNYGLLGVLDYTHDTDAEFQAYHRSLKGAPSLGFGSLCSVTYVSMWIGGLRPQCCDDSVWCMM